MNQHILVVDDEAVTRAFLCRLLERLGYRAVPVANGMEAIAAVTTGSNAYALAVLDMVMPGMDGEATCKALHQFQPDLPVLVCTGGCDAAALQRLLHSGNCEQLSKPFKMEALRGKIKDLLARQAHPVQP